MRRVLDELPGVERLTQVGVRDFCQEERSVIERSAGRVQTFFDSALARTRLAGGLLETFSSIVSSLPDQVYVSFDIDGLDPKLCPHTGTPVPGGLEFSEASLLLGEIVASGRRIVGFDLSEVSPGPDGDEWDGNVGARVLYKLIGWTLRSRAGNG
jgi:agmatinase